MSIFKNEYILFLLRYKDDSQIFTRGQSIYDTNLEGDTIVSLIVYNMSHSDSGGYQLTVGSSIGEATSNDTTVIVLGDIFKSMEYIENTLNYVLKYYTECG